MTPDAQPESRFRLALFPLPVVLLPGASMPLHIFEQRYRDLVRDCLAADRTFGLIYHNWDTQGPFLCEEGRIGGVAEIREHEALEDGRSLIMIEGVGRFRVSDGIESEARYFEALVTEFRDADSIAPQELAKRRTDSIRLFRSVVASLPEAPQHLPDVAPDRETSFVLAHTIQGHPAWHQQLLELSEEGARLTELDRVFRAALG